MIFRDIGITTCATFILMPIIIAGIVIGHAQAMQSTSYRIESDSVNFGGGLASSTNYVLESTGGELATGDSASTGYALKAGYQQMTTQFLAMTSPSAVTMTPSIIGITGGESNGSTTVTVTTDNSAGYELSIRAGVSPALVKGSDSISDYAPSGDPDYTFTTDTDDAHFGYSPSGVDVVMRFKDDGGVCNDDTQETPLACWDGLAIAEEVISRSGGANTPSGATTTIYFRVGIGSGVVQPAGEYVATTTITAIAL